MHNVWEFNIWRNKSDTTVWFLKAAVFYTVLVLLLFCCCFFFPIIQNIFFFSFHLLSIWKLFTKNAKSIVQRYVIFLKYLKRINKKKRKEENRFAQFLNIQFIHINKNRLEKTLQRTVSSRCSVCQQPVHSFQITVVANSTYVCAALGWRVYQRASYLYSIEETPTK